jgi:hypothetical protein
LQLSNGPVFQSGTGEAQVIAESHQEFDDVSQGIAPHSNLHVIPT